jgi:hypothetical protein
MKYLDIALTTIQASQIPPEILQKKISKQMEVICLGNDF